MCRTSAIQNCCSYPRESNYQTYLTSQSNLGEDQVDKEGFACTTRRIEKDDAFLLVLDFCKHDGIHIILIMDNLWFIVLYQSFQLNDIVADWPMGQSLFLMSHTDVSLVNILLSITRVSLVQNNCVFCQLRVHYIGDPGITKTYPGIQHVNILQYLHELNGNVHYINISNVPTLNCAACKLQRFNRDERGQLCNCAACTLQRFNRNEQSAVRELWIRPIRMPSV